MALWTYTVTENIDRAVVVYLHSGRKETASVIALAEWDGPDGGVFILGRSLDTKSESWRRFDEGGLQARAWAEDHGMRAAEGPLRTVGEMRVKP